MIERVRIKRRYRIGLCSFLRLSGLCFFLLLWPTLARADAIKTVENLLREQRFQELAEILPRIAAARPTHPTILYAQAVLEKDAGRAATLFQQITTLKTPYADDARFRLAQYRYHLGQYEKSKQDFARLIERYPQSRLIDEIDKLD